MNITVTALMTALHLDAWRKKKEADSYSLSRPIKKKVHGITVEKAPVGRYIDMTKRLPNIVMEVLDATFPGMKPDEILRMLSNADQAVVRDLITRLIAIAPEKLVEILADILGADKKAVLALTPDELMDVLETFWTLNDYTDFFQRVRKATNAMRSRQNGLSNGGSPADAASASASAS